MANKRGRLYAPFFKKSKDDKRWKRAMWPASDKGLVPEHPMKAYKHEYAVKVYQDWLLAPLLGYCEYEVRELRPVKDAYWSEY